MGIATSVITLLLLLFVALNTTGISDSLRRLAAHHEKFTPELPPARPMLEEGDVLLIRSFGIEQAVRVLSMVDGDDVRVVNAEPIGARQVGGDQSSTVTAP